MRLQLLGDDRGLSEVLGSILVFALVVSVLATLQVSAVPALNEQVEFEHNIRMQDDMRGFGSAIDTAAASGIDQPVDIETGVRYPPRFFLINPGPTAGTLTTTGSADVSFENLAARDPEVADYLDANAAYTTTGLVYQPAYNQYSVAPETRYENGVVYNVDADGGVSVLDGGALVTGRRITLTTLDGDVATSASDAVSLTLVPVSGPASVVPVTNSAAGPLTLVVETDLSAETWRTQILADEFDGSDSFDDRYIDDIACANGNVATPCNGDLTITFEEGFTYELRLAKVAFAGSADTEEGPAYLTKVGPATPALTPGGTDLTVELRDAYNNPVRGAEVRFEITGGFAAFAADPVGRTDADGRFTVAVDPINNTTDIDVVAWHDLDGDGTPNESPALTAAYTGLPVTDNTQTPTGDLVSINPREGTIEFVDLDTQTNDRSVLFVTFRNADTGTEWTIDRMRISFLLGSEPVDTVDITRLTPAESEVANDFPIGESLRGVDDLTFAPGETVELEFDFPANIRGNGQPFDGLIIVSVEATSDAGETATYTYFVAN